MSNFPLKAEQIWLGDLFINSDRWFGNMEHMVRN